MKSKDIRNNKLMQLIWLQKIEIKLKKFPYQVKANSFFFCRIIMFCSIRGVIKTQRVSRLQQCDSVTSNLATDAATCHKLIWAAAIYQLRANNRRSPSRELSDKM